MFHNLKVLGVLLSGLNFSCDLTNKQINKQFYISTSVNTVVENWLKHKYFIWNLSMIEFRHDTGEKSSKSTRHLAKESKSWVISDVGKKKAVEYAKT